MSSDETTRPRRERSARYPGVPLAESVDLCKFLDSRGLDGLPAADIATALGYKNIKTNTFSARLSSARQFGLLNLVGDGYALTPLAREVLHPIDPADRSRLHRQALLNPPLYADLADRLAGKRVPEAAILANLLYHHYQITASAKLSAAEAFLDSARFAGALGDDNVFRPQTPAPAETPVPTPVPPPTPLPSESPPSARPRPRTPSAEVRVDLRLWGPDEGKLIRLRAPEAITAASFERFLQAFRLHVRIEAPPGPGANEDAP